MRVGLERGANPQDLGDSLFKQFRFSKLPHYIVLQTVIEMVEPEN